MTDIIDHLKEPELSEYRVLTAKEAIAVGGNSLMSVDEGISAQLEAWEFLRIIQERYDIDPNDSFDIRVYDGAIVRAE
jgi:hypothetical protein